MTKPAHISMTVTAKPPDTAEARALLAIQRLLDENPAPSRSDVIRLVNDHGSDALGLAAVGQLAVLVNDLRQPDGTFPWNEVPEIAPETMADPNELLREALGRNSVSVPVPDVFGPRPTP